MKKGFLQVLVLSVFFVSNCFCFNVAMLPSVYAAEAELATGAQMQQADKLLNLYFRRIDSFYEKGKYSEAKNELSKVYIIDPSNGRAQEYESRIAQAQRNKLTKKEKNLAKREALLGEQKILKALIKP